MMEFKNPYAYYKNQIVSATEMEVSTGFNCLMCMGPMVIKRGKVRRVHFAHKANACSINSESALHLLGKEIVCQLTEFVIKDPRTGKFKLIGGFQSSKEEKIGGLRIDVLLKFANSKRQLAIEIAVTHKCDDNKILEFQSLNLPAIEIDLSEIDRDAYSLPEVKSAILSELRNPNWLYNRKMTVRRGKRWDW